MVWWTCWRRGGRCWRRGGRCWWRGGVIGGVADNVGGVVDIVGGVATLFALWGGGETGGTNRDGRGQTMGDDGGIE